jgi:hypothetical protein
MFLLSVLSSILFQGFSVEPFRVGDAEPGHNQTGICSAIASDGRFAVAWHDDNTTVPPAFAGDVYVRFFEIAGSPLTPPIKIDKDSAIYTTYPCLGIDTLGNAILIYEERYADYFTVKLQLFDRNGIPKGPANSVVQVNSLSAYKPLSLSVNKKGEFVVAWATDFLSTYSHIWLRRYSSDGTPSGEPFLAHDSTTDTTHFQYPAVALNEEGDIAIAWSVFKTYDSLRLQVIDSLNQPILPWEPMGRIVLEESEKARPEIHWLDNDRFIIFSNAKYPVGGLNGTVFNDKGFTEHESAILFDDSIYTPSGPEGHYSTTFCNERFAVNFNRLHYDESTAPSRYWAHQGAVVGDIVNDKPMTAQGPFEYSSPLEGDTANYWNGGAVYHVTVSANENNLVWAYSRVEPDSTVKAYVTISDWNITGIDERSLKEAKGGFEVLKGIGCEAVLRYEGFPAGFRATVFDATGRKVDEISTPNQSGVLFWGPRQNRGIYFIVPQDSKSRPTKIVLIR